jgi:hypothetical protein
VLDCEEELGEVDQSVEVCVKMFVVLIGCDLEKVYLVC